MSLDTWAGRGSMVPGAPPWGLSQRLTLSACISDPVSLDTSLPNHGVTKEASMGKKARKPMAARAEESGMNEGAELPERWSVQGKTELVLRLLRGEALDTVSRESQIPAHELESWKRVFLDTGARGLKTRAEPE